MYFSTVEQALDRIRFKAPIQQVNDEVAVQPKT